MWILVVAFSTGICSVPLQMGPFMEYSQCTKIQTQIESAYQSASIVAEARCINLQPR